MVISDFNKSYFNKEIGTKFSLYWVGEKIGGKKMGTARRQTTSLKR